jgi:UDP-glucuronate 4-epimerase
LIVLVTGAAGFIGSSLAIGLLKRGDIVVGVDNHNNYYDPALKEDRVARHLDHPNYTHIRADITDQEKVKAIFSKYKFDSVVNLAAQAGVRYSIENPLSYIYTNILGFTHILEACRHNNIAHLVYASSSSVYGSNTKIPYSVDDNVDHPISLYAATKKSNELMAHAYSHLYNLPTTGLRFFTVYGPWDRPDMALQNFTKLILKGEKIKVFNNGNHKRDFTYIDDIVGGIMRVIDKPAIPHPIIDPNKPSTSSAPWRVYNIGNNSPVNLLDYIEALEKSLKIEAKKEFLPLQPGDVVNTYADISELIEDFNYKPKVSIQEGIANYSKWYRSYYNC